MKRRCYLASVALASVSLSGCSTLGEEISVPFPREERGSDVVRFVHEHDGEPVARVSFIDRPSAPSTRRLRVTIAQPAETMIQRAELQFTAESALDESQIRKEPADEDIPLFVRSLPSDGSNEAEISRRDGSTLIDGRDHGRGTVSYEVLADFSTADGGVGPVTVGYEIELAERERLNDTFLALHRTTLPSE